MCVCMVGIVILYLCCHKLSFGFVLSEWVMFLKISKFILLLTPLCILDCVWFFFNIYGKSLLLWIYIYFFIIYIFIFSRVKEILRNNKINVLWYMFYNFLFLKWYLILGFYFWYVALGFLGGGCSDMCLNAVSYYVITAWKIEWADIYFFKVVKLEFFE